MNKDLKAFDMFGCEVLINGVYTCSVSDDYYIITNIKGDNYVIGEKLNKDHEVIELDANTLY